jgi:hypothetical protein
MKNRRLTYLLLVGILLVAGFAKAQKADYKNEVRMAERFIAEGKYTEAGERYAAAYGAKTSKSEYANLAAEQFYLTKDYARAAEYFKLVAKDWKNYPLAGLKYARSLKQAQRYSLATKAYVDFLDIYKGDDRAIIQELVELEVKGTEMARQAAESYNTDVAVDQLGDGVNTLKNELAPMPLAEGTVYYLSDVGGYTRMYRSNFVAKKWTKGELATQFPIVPGKNVGSGSLGPTGDRFYFSLCDARSVMGQPTAPCEIVVIVNKNGEWGKPQALPPYINTAGNSTSQPCVYKDGDVEVMLFSSDRLDGYGGMDLYRSERYLDSDATDFSFPENLGPVVNSVGDEVTPFYDPESQTLHFSSNGYINMGGYDIFKTRGKGLAWNTPENVKAPINSSADDYYYREAPKSSFAFFASNRALEGSKTRTSNEDIFTVRPGSPSITVSVQVVDSANSRPLRNVAMAVYTKVPGATRRLVTSQMSEDGYFSLKLPIDADLDFDVQALDYRRRVQIVSTPAGKKKNMQLPPLRMARIKLPLVDAQRIDAERTDAPVGSIPAEPLPLPQNPPPAPQRAPSQSRETSISESTVSPIPSGSVKLDQNQRTTVSETSSTPEPVSNPTSQVPRPTSQVSDRSEPVSRPTSQLPRPTEPVRNPTSEIPRTSTEYRIQIEARRDFSPEHRRYNRAREVGAVSSNYIESKDLHRVLIGSYPSYGEAQQALSAVKNAGWNDAFIAYFKDGRYKGLASSRR